MPPALHSRSAAAASHIGAASRPSLSLRLTVCVSSYEARAAGVKRNMRGDAAREVCPEIQLVQASLGVAFERQGGSSVCSFTV